MRHMTDKPADCPDDFVERTDEELDQLREIKAEIEDWWQTYDCVERADSWEHPDLSRVDENTVRTTLSSTRYRSLLYVQVRPDHSKGSGQWVPTEIREEIHALGLEIVDVSVEQTTRESELTGEQVEQLLITLWLDLRESEIRFRIEG